MPKININGVVREMTAEEIAELEALDSMTPERHEDTGLEQRVAELEMQLKFARILLGAEE